MYIFDHIHSFPLRMKYVSDKSCRENQNTFYIQYISSFENSAVYETMFKTFVKPGRPQMTIWRMHIASWITKATNAHLE